MNDSDRLAPQRAEFAAAGAGIKTGIAPYRRPDPCGSPVLFQAARSLLAYPQRAIAAGDCRGPARIENSGAMRGAALVKHSVRIAGHATSVSLEPAFWQPLGEIAGRRGVAVNALLTEIGAERGGNLSSAIRLFVLESCRRGELLDR
jgi:predicted DNA-binding ribbon-helix-helix protein